MAQPIIEPQAAPEVQITAAQAKLLGYDNIADLTAHLRKAKDDKDALDKIVPDLASAITEFSKSVNEFTQLKAREIESENFDELSKDKFVKRFKELPENDPIRADIVKSLLGKYQGDHVELALTADGFKKSLLRPITPRNSEYEDTQELRKAWDAAFTLTAIRKGVIEGEEGDAAQINMGTLKRAVDTLDKLGLPGVDRVKKYINEKALDTVTSGEGAEWLPTILSANAIEEIMMDLRVVPLFKRYPMPSKKFEIPAYMNRTRGYIVDEAILDTNVGDSGPFFTNMVKPSGVESRKIAFEARKFGMVVFLSDEIEEDAILPTLDIVQSEMRRGLGESFEDSVINGHYSLSAGGLNGYFDNAGSTGNRLFSEADGARDARALWDGLRAMAFKSGVTLVDGAPASDWKAEGLDIYRNARKAMGKYGQVNLADLAWLISLSQHIELLKLDELITIDKYGPSATVLSGEIARLDGIPLVVTPYMYENLNNYGTYSNGEAVTYGAGQGSLTGQTSSTVANKTMSMCVNRRVAAFADRRMVRMESERQPLAGQRYVLGTWRGDFKKLYQPSDKMIGVVRNLSC